MKKGTVIVLVVVAVILIAGYSMVKGAYNNMVSRQEAVRAQWSNVENQYQRRQDLIPNLVNTVRGYAEHESSTLEAVIEARSRATQANINFDDLNAETLGRLNAAQGELSTALGRLMAISESYPDLKANQNFLDLQAQLEGTENRISVERRKFNDDARSYNTYIRQFPRTIFASMFGFETIAYFESQQGAETAPEVNFGN